LSEKHRIRKIEQKERNLTHTVTPKMGHMSENVTKPYRWKGKKKGLGIEELKFSDKSGWYRKEKATAKVGGHCVLRHKLKGGNPRVFGGGRVEQCSFVGVNN